MTNERQLALVEFLRSHARVPFDDIYANVFGYQGLERETAKRYLSRDITDLSKAGIPVECIEERYLYNAQAPVVAAVSQLDLGLLQAALGAISKKDRRIFAARNGLQKLLAQSQPSSSAPRYMHAAIPAGDAVLEIAQAIQASTTISFDYSRGEATPSHYELRPAELTEYFDAFYISGEASKNGGPWSERTFRVSRIDISSLEKGAHFEARPRNPRGHDTFRVPSVRIAIRPETCAPLASRGQQLSEVYAKEAWPVFQFDAVDLNRLFETLFTYGKDAILIGPEDVVDRWRNRLGHLVSLGESQ